MVIFHSKLLDLHLGFLHESFSRETNPRVSARHSKPTNPLHRDGSGYVSQTQESIYHVWYNVIPSGKRLQKTMERSTMLFMGKLTISMAIFNSELLVYQRVSYMIFDTCEILTIMILYVHPSTLPVSSDVFFRSDIRLILSHTSAAAHPVRWLLGYQFGG